MLLGAVALVSAQTDPAAAGAPTGTATATETVNRKPADNPLLKPAPAAAPTPAPAPRESMMSAVVAAQVAATLPKYTPPPKAAPASRRIDLRDLDKPKNHIIRLPRYVVHAPPPPVLSERAVHTRKGLADIAMRRYMTETDRALNAFTLPLFGTSMESRALSMYAEDERLKNMAELKSDAAMVSATDKKEGLYVKRLVDQTFMRSGEFDSAGH